MLMVMDTMMAIPTPCARATPSGPMLPVVGPLATNATTLPAPRNTNSSVPMNSAVSGRRSLGMTYVLEVMGRGESTSIGTSQHHRGVDPAEPERVGEHHLRRRRSAVAAQAVQVAGRVGTLEIDRGRKPAPLHGERADRRFDRPARAEGVAVVALGAADTEPVGVVAEDLLDRRGLRRVVERS